MKRLIGMFLLAGIVALPIGTTAAAYNVSEESLLQVQEQSLILVDETDADAEPIVIEDPEASKDRNAIKILDTTDTPVFTWANDYSSCTATVSDSETPVVCLVTSQVTKNATCTEEGTLTYTAKIPGTSYVDYKTKSIPATGHSWNSGVITKKATCAATGVKTYTCQKCHTTKTKSIAKTAHKWGAKKLSQKATPSKNGAYSHTCTVCGLTKDYQHFPHPDTALASTVNYNGSIRHPSVRVINTKGSRLDSQNYSVTYLNKTSKNPGIYLFRVTLKGSLYSGTMTGTYKIRPLPTLINSLTAQKGGFKAVWTRRSTQISGYQLQYSLRKEKSGAVTKNIPSKKTNKLKVSGLKKGTTYYVRVRTYKVSNKKTIYSTWSEWNFITTRK